MKITLLCVGKLKEKYWTAACQEYSKRLSKYAQLQILEIEEEKSKANNDALIQQVVEKEGQRLLDKIKKEEYVILLSLQGKDLTSEQLAAHIDQVTINGISSFCFVIGGSCGTSQAVEKRANFSLKLGNLTYPHQLARVMILEAIYRSFKILNNEIYHK